MCTILFAYKVHPSYPLVVIGNRDEFYSRPASGATLWPESPVIAGRDLSQGGTWMGVSKTGRIGFITNFRDFKLIRDNRPSRGLLLKDFLFGSGQMEARLMASIEDHNPYNMVYGSLAGLRYFSSVKGTLETLDPGLYGLSNRHLDTPWEKVTKAKASFAKALERESLVISELFAILSDREKTLLNLPRNTGLTEEREYDLSSIFVELDGYGTRQQTVILFHEDATVSLYERYRSRDAWKNKLVVFSLDFQGA
jgi:uncharacterized protein with NRDE domain